MSPSNCCVSFTVDGKRYWCYGKTKAEARENAKVKKALIEANVKKAKAGYTVREWSYMWLDSYKDGRVSKAWYIFCKNIIDNYIVPSLGNRSIKDIKPIDINRMLNSYTDMSQSFGKKLLQVTRQIFDTAVENDIIIKDPSRRAKLPEYREKIGHRTITPFERELTIKTANKHPDIGLFFLIMLYCGLRPQEVSALRYSDIKDNSFHIERARKSDGTIGKPKSKAGVRDVPIPDVLMPYLTGTTGLVCTSEQGRPLTRTSQKRMWYKFKRLMEIENGATLFRNEVMDPVLPDDLVPYCYRHTYCTDLQDAGVPVTVASRLMGHSDIKITAEIYTHHSQDSYEDARDKINKVHARYNT